MTKTKVCLICQKYQLNREYLPMHRALERKFDLTRYFVDDGWPTNIDEIQSHEKYEAVIWYVRFREFVTKPPFDWKKFRGVRILYDQDAYQDFSLLAGDRFLGAWPKLFRSNNFDTLICTGKATRDNLLEAGVHAVWVPKAYDQKRFFNKGEHRKGICYFGELYNARRAMLAYLKNRDIHVTRFKCSFFELNDYLNRFEICLICNMVATLEKGRSKLLNYLIPNYGIQISSGPEVMLKNFEVAATGCVQFCDKLPDLEDLGFEDGKTVVSYTGFDDLIAKLELYKGSPERLFSISNNAAALCVERHTWDHRAEMFAAVVEGCEPTLGF